MYKISTIDIKTIITDPNGAQILVKEADGLGRDLKNSGLSTNQIRALFGEVRQIQSQWNIDKKENRKKALRRLILLKPKMAYRAKKERGEAVKELVGVLEPALNEVIDEQNEQKQNQNFERFIEFFEAILAYHRGYGGK